MMGDLDAGAIEFGKATPTATGWRCGYHGHEWTHVDAEGWEDLADVCTECYAECLPWSAEKRARVAELRAIDAAEIRAYGERDC